MAYGLLAFFFIGYFVLAGLDIGVGMLLPFLGPDRRLTIAAIAPFFLAGEVWLVGSAGLLNGLFPDLETDVFGRAWGAIVAVVVGWIVRDMGLWLRGRVDSMGWRRLCDAAIVAGSWTIAIAWGVAIGILLGGALFAVTTCALFALHGAVFAAVRLPNAPSNAQRIALIALVAGVPCAIASGELGKVLPVGVVLAVVLGVGWWVLGQGRPARALPLTALAMAAPPVLAGLALPSPSGASSLVVTGATVLLPFLVASQAWMWWLFRGPVTRPSYL